MSATPPILGLVLAGGLARRMGGGDKALIRIGDRTILERVLDRLQPWLADVALSGAAYQKAGAGVQNGVEKAVAAEAPAATTTPTPCETASPGWVIESSSCTPTRMTAATSR